MAIVQALERAGDVDVEVVVGRIFLRADPCQIREQVFMHIRSERLGSQDLVVGGGVEGQRLGGDIQDL